MAFAGVGLWLFPSYNFVFTCEVAGHFLKPISSRSPSLFWLSLMNHPHLAMIFFVFVLFLFLRLFVLHHFGLVDLKHWKKSV